MRSGGGACERLAPAAHLAIYVLEAEGGASPPIEAQYQCQSGSSESESAGSLGKAPLRPPLAPIL